MADGHGASRRDPFAGLDGRACAEVLRHKGWPVRVEGADLVVDLGEVVALVATGRVGSQTLERLTGAHGALPEAPAHKAFAEDGEGRVVRYFRAPAGGVPSATNLHGVAPGVSVRGAGCVERIPPSVERQVLLRWMASAHPATTPLAELPRWLAEMARDPAGAAKAWDYVRPSADATRALDAWEKELTMHRGRPMASFANACTILRRAPAYAGRIVFNELVQGATLEGATVTEGMLGKIRERCEREHGVAFSSEVLRGALATVSEERRVHPVREYLAGLAWDGTGRLDAVAGTILGAAAPLAALLVRRFFVGAVARVLRPGCKLDTALVLVGPQGVRKSTFFATLGGEWFTDTHVDLASKDAYLQLAGAWIVEWGEIERVTGRRGADEIKSFLSSRVDRFRPPYGRAIVEVPRSCVLVGSTNESTFLDDDTGSRRFFCVRVQSVNVSLLTAWRDQLWAEARTAFEAGEPWWLDAEHEGERAEDAEQHAIEDPWASSLLRWLSLGDQEAREDFTAAEVLAGAVDVPRKDQDRRAMMRVGKILRAAGWERRKHRPVREGRTGDPVWCWFRPVAKAKTEVLDEAPPW